MTKIRTIQDPNSAAEERISAQEKTRVAKIAAKDPSKRTEQEKTLLQKHMKMVSKATK